MEIVLASASPRRKEILEALGVRFTVYASNIKEVIDTDLTPSDIAKSLAYQKGISVAKKYPDKLVISADTLVEAEGKILGKPENAQDALNTLKLLSGKEHRVYTGICVCCKGKIVSDVDMTTVKFKSLSDDEINDYIKTKEPFGKAGSYGIQTLGSVMIEKISGDFYNVVGLPVFKLSEVLKNEFNVNILRLKVSE